MNKTKTWSILSDGKPIIVEPGDDIGSLIEFIIGDKDDDHSIYTKEGLKYIPNIFEDLDKIGLTNLRFELFNDASGVIYFKSKTDNGDVTMKQFNTVADCVYSQRQSFGVPSDQAIGIMFSHGFYSIGANGYRKS